MISELKNKWKEITFLSLLYILELYMFSSLVIRLSPIVTAIVCVLLVGIMIPLVVNIIKEKKVDKQHLKIFLFFSLVALACGVARSYLFIVSLLIAYMFYDNKKLLYKWMFIIMCIGLSVFLILCFLTVIPDMPIFRGDIDNVTNIRHTFGFGHPNHIMKFFFNALIWGYLWLCDNKKKTLIYTVCAFAIAFFIYYNTHCRTGMMTVIGTLIIMNFPIFINWIKTKWLYVIGVVATILMIISYVSPQMGSLLSGRPYFYNLFISEYPLSILLGKGYEGIFTYPLDNSFMYTIFDGGIVALLVITYTFYHSFKNKEDTKTKVALIGVLVYSLFEALCTIYATPLYILMFMELLEVYFKKESNKKMEEIVKLGESSN